MMYVLCVTHIIYWFNTGTEPIRSLILIEMPIIFFISGAAVSLATPKPFWQTITNRVKRVVVPYYIYALTILVGIILLSILWYFFNQQLISAIGQELICKQTYDITAYQWQDIWNIITFHNISQAHYMYHLWFIIPYLILTCTFSLQVNLMNKTNRWIYVSICLIIFIIFQKIKVSDLLTTLLGYNIFMTIGYLFYRKIKIWQVICIFFLTTAIIVLHLTDGGFFCPMQNHKFPPDWLFVTYNLAILCFLSLIFWKTKIPYKTAFALWNTRGYTIYLYQSVVFFLVAPLNMLFFCKIDILPIRWCICALLVWGLSTILSYITYPFELYVMKKTRIIKEKK